jgi:Pyrimidine dimer DNA glycosylase
MRLWSLNPRYLDSVGLVALWREGLLAQAVLRGDTTGYRHHPQLDRFRAAAAPVASVAEYLRGVHAESAARGYSFARGKIARHRSSAPLAVTRGQLDFEWEHLVAKLRVRAPEWLAGLRRVARPAPHPSFRVVRGGLADWERG